MDAITHTILAVAVIAGAYYGGRWQQVREARRMWGHIATPEMKREIQLMDALIKHMSREDQDYVDSLSAEDFDKEPLQLELFKEYTEYGYSPSE
jgi:hypothetical protein